jgi:hypothetical protein
MHSLPGMLMAFMEAVPGGGVTVVEECRPGLELSCRVAEHAASDVILLRGHGVILHADDPGCVDRWHRAEQAFCNARGLELLGRRLEHAPPSPSALRALADELSPAPLREYFPDVAVFRDRLLPLLAPVGAPSTGEPRFRLLPGAWEGSPDLAETWLAVQLLHHVCPAFPALGASVTAGLASLPTEAFRRARSGATS